MSEYPLPDAFIQQMLPLLGDEAEAFFASYADAPRRGIRFRDARRPLPPADLTGEIPYARNGCYLAADSPAGALPLHEAGAYYLQEPSAMAAAAVLCAQDGDRVLDLCAAPGGKSTQLAMSANLRLLVANEPVPARAQVLSRNMERMGVANAVVTCAYPDALADRWPQFFDKILVDAPCSGEGMFRRHPETRAEWSADAPQRCHERQVQILTAAARMLRPGGRLVLSTCTFNAIENEGTVRAFLQAHSHFRLLPIQVEGLPAAENGMLRLWPHKFAGEGHFISLLEKTAAREDEPAPAAPVPLPAADKATLQAYAAFQQEIGCEVAANAQFGGRLLHVPEALPPLERLRVLRVGLQLGELRGKLFFPDHALALAAPLKKCRALDEAQALRYLHGEALPCPAACRGFYALTLDGWQLGFGKASDGQMKNHYPKGLRK